MEAKHPVANAFLTGVLAVAVASPCTAPFMGASLGFAATLPPGEAMAIFLALGFGMALPYLAAAWFPAFAGWLPRPGAWMATFRRLMAFPMFATVAWLVWVLGQQSGIDGAASLLGLLVALSMVVWALTLHGRTRMILGAVALAGLAFVAWSIGGAITRPAAATLATSSDSRWQPWAPERVQQLVAAGKPVFVDFTAAWCVTCQLNKKTTLSREDVLADFDKGQFTLLRADWTRRDPAITAALAQLGRNGVPVYVVYRPGRAPVVLSEVLGVEEVRNAIGPM
jgi:thiol:disulfide interchange protein DsbD